MLAASKGDLIIGYSKIPFEKPKLSRSDLWKVVLLTDGRKTAQRSKTWLLD